MSWYPSGDCEEYGYYVDGDKEKDFVIHRLDGPARVWHDGILVWLYHGTPAFHVYSQEQFEVWLKYNKF